MQYETASTTRQPRGEHRGTIKGLQAPLRDKDNTFTTLIFTELQVVFARFVCKTFERYLIRNHN